MLTMLQNRLNNLLLPPVAKRTTHQLQIINDKLIYELKTMFLFSMYLLNSLLFSTDFKNSQNMS